MKFIKKFESIEDNSKFIGDMYIPETIDNEIVKIEDLKGKIIVDIKYNENDLYLRCEDSSDSEIYYHFTHYQDCCESVWLDDISGYLSDLIDYPVLKAEERTNTDLDIKPNLHALDDSTTWTFYVIATINGYVTFRWCGTSNGYYSEVISVSRSVCSN